MDSKRFSMCFANAAGSMCAHMEALCKLDSGIGDGDHGVTVARGFDAAQEVARSYEGEPADMLMAVGAAMAASMGGAIGPIYGVFWKEVGKAFAQEKSIGEAFEAGAMGVMRVGMAARGDKTIVDAMMPCALAAKAGHSLVESLQLGAKAAREGAMATSDMVAKKGRAKFLREKSVGFVDPGAMSFALFIEAWAKEEGESE